MLKRIIKNQYFTYLVSFVLFVILRAIYCTLRYKDISPLISKNQQLLQSKKTICLFWHQYLAIAPAILRHMHNVHAVASPHSDGKLIGHIIKLLGHHIIWGSSNRNPFSVIKQIYQLLQNNTNIIVTPDGPKGPANRFNSNIHKIALKTNTPIILFSCHASKYIQLNSWDRMLIPLPFATITYKIELLDVSQYDTKNSVLIEKVMNQMDKDCQSIQGIK